MRILKKAMLGIALCASTVGAVAPASAQYYRGDRHYRHHNNDAGTAIAAGIIGLGIGAALASDRRDRYYDGYRYDRPRYRGYYYQPYYRDRHYRDHYRYDRRYYRGYRDCYTQRFWDDYRGRWVRVRRCG